MTLRAPLLFAALCAGVLLTAPAAANGRFPAANQIVVDPTDPMHIVARTTYGILVTSDGGVAWDWICEQSVEWTGQYDPPVALSKDGSLIAGVYDHLGVGTQGGCAWDRPLPLEGLNVVDVSAQKDDPATVVALTSTGQNGMFATRVWRSSNNGKDWAQLGVDLPADVLGLTIDVAPSDPLSIAITGQIGKGGPGVLERSNDGGMTWEQRAIPGTDLDHAPYLGAVDPTDPMKLYVRLSGPKGTLLVTPDQGETWQSAFVAQGILKGFALSPDGSALLIGGETDGVHRMSTADLSEQKISDLHAQCLVWSKEAVYACAPEAKDGFTVGISTDEGKTFTALEHLACVRGPLMCDAATEVGKSCPAVWQATAELIDQPSCPKGTGGSGGSGGAGGAGGGAGGGGAGGGGTGGTTMTTGAGGTGGGETGGGKGCGCTTAGRAPGGAAGVIALVAALAGLGSARRRKRRAER